MSGDWQVGDLAECITDRWSQPWAYNPKRGDILRVAKVGLHMGEMAIGFEGKPMRQGWDATAFRKIAPDHTPCAPCFAFHMKAISFAVKNRKARA